MFRPANAIKERFREELRFFKGWMRQPGAVGSIKPTGPAVSRAMAAYAPVDNPLPVLELGPGTGVITAAILERGIAPGRIVSIEYSEDFHGHLVGKFPAVNFIRGDAFEMIETLRETPWRRFCAVISAIPLLNVPKPKRAAIVRDGLSLMAPGGAFVQMSYGPNPPTPAAAGQYSVEATDWIVKNVPPVRLFIYRQECAKS